MDANTVNSLYNASLVTVGAVGNSMLSKKILREPLGTPESLKGTVKLAVAVGASSLAVAKLESKGYIQKTPYKI